MRERDGKGRKNTDNFAHVLDFDAVAELRRESLQLTTESVLPALFHFGSDAVGMGLAT